MKKLFAAAAVAAAMVMAPANAAVLDFANEADTNGERGVASGSYITIDGLTVQLITYSSNGSPYLDAGNAGLGVCKVLDANDQCDPGNDDNVTAGEGIGIVFENNLNITELVFRDKDHNLINAANDGMVELWNNTTGGPVGTFLFSELMAMAIAGHALLTDINFLGLVFVDKQFYVSSVTAVPLPGAIPLLLSGIAGLGFASRKKKEA